MREDHWILVPLEHGGHESGAAARAVLGEKEVELVVDSHHLGDAALHHVLEVRVEPGNNQKCNSTQSLIKC